VTKVLLTTPGRVSRTVEDLLRISGIIANGRHKAPVSDYTDNMGLSSPQELSACLLYATSDLDDENQLASIEHRQQLTQAWGIPPGATVLEIGPGQGDLTVVLADVVGPTGRVVAVDNAPLEWGMSTFAFFSSPLPLFHQ
jgi:hypothetical protein